MFCNALLWAHSAYHAPGKVIQEPESYMLPIPSALQAQFEEHLRKSSIPEALHRVHAKWLRYS
jgi:hypothetical protein